MWNKKRIKIIHLEMIQKPLWINAINWVTNLNLFWEYKPNHKNMQPETPSSRVQYSVLFCQRNILGRRSGKGNFTVYFSEFQILQFPFFVTSADHNQWKVSIIIEAFAVLHIFQCKLLPTNPAALWSFTAVSFHYSTASFSLSIPALKYRVRVSALKTYFRVF